MWSNSGMWEICRYLFHPAPTSPVKYNGTAGTTTPRPYDVEGMVGEYFTSKCNEL